MSRLTQFPFLYQPERGPKREYQNIVTLFKRCRITVVIRSFGNSLKSLKRIFAVITAITIAILFVREKA